MKFIKSTASDLFEIIYHFSGLKYLKRKFLPIDEPKKSRRIGKITLSGQPNGFSMVSELLRRFFWHSIPTI